MHGLGRWVSYRNDKKNGQILLIHTFLSSILNTGCIIEHTGNS